MMDVGFYDPAAQVEEVSAKLKAMDIGPLYDAVDAMSTSLVMGFENYLRQFDSQAAVPLLADVCETFIKDDEQGDILVIALRALSLMMEHVPSSYEAAQPLHRSVMQIASMSIHRALCLEWRYVHGNNAAMVEEALRVMRFISKDDLTGELIQYALVGDLLTLCTDPQPLVARRALETLLMISSKVVMPSELEKPTKSVTAGFFSFFKSKKKSGAASGSERSKSGHQGSATSLSSAATTAAAEDIVPYADHPTVVQVENVIAPLLVSLVEQYAKSLASIPEHWALLELSLQSVGTLIERALICHRPHTARALASPLLPKILFQLIVATESNVVLEPCVRVDRVLLCETTLTLLTNCHRNMMLESLQLPVAHRFFKLILDESTDEITTLLEDPFPRAVIATRSTQRRDKDHITSIVALQLFVLACPTVPPDAFGLKPKLVLPVHQWMWEDELRHDNRLMEEQCVSLETSWTRLDHKSRITVHLKQLDADLRIMTMSKGTRGGFRNISRSYVPFVCHFADEVALRPIVAVKEAGPCSVDGTTLIWRSDPSAVMSGRATVTSATEHNADAGTAATPPQSATRKSHLKSTGSLQWSTPSISASPNVVLNTQIDVQEKHIAIAEEYFGSLCTFAKNTSGQMAKQVATCACASMLQLMFLSQATERFEELMGKAVLPMCEMFREALLSADKATKAVVLTMIEWMLYHPMAEPCEFTESALRCGLLDQLDVVSKATLVVRDKPTRTASMADKAGALAHCIIDKIKERRAGQASRAGASADIMCDAPLGGIFLSRTMVRVRKVLEELRGCRCGKNGVAAAIASSSTTRAKANTSSDQVHESAIRELLRLFHEATEITAYEVYNVGVASVLLYYLLGDMTLEELVGDGARPITAGAGTGGAGTSPAPCRRGSVAESESHTGPLDTNRNASSWATMMASGMHAADILGMFVHEPRMRCLIQSAVTYPVGMRRLVAALVENIPLQGQLPMVESVVTFDKVLCKTPLQAHEALCRIAPLIMLCGDAGRSIAAAIRPAVKEESTLPTDVSSPDGIKSRSSGPVSPAEGVDSRPARRSNSNLTSHRSGATTVLHGVPNMANISRIAKECCMEGHRLRAISVYPRSHVCDKCARVISSGRNCRTCNYDICDDCYRRYSGNVELIKSIASMERNRVHLCATIGDLERWFRTGSTSSKGTQLAPTSQSSLHHLERFTIRVLTYLRRFSPATTDTSALAPVLTNTLSHKTTTSATGGSGSNARNFLAFADPVVCSSATAELAEKLLSNPEAVRRLAYLYLEKFAARGTLNDEGTAIPSARAEELDVMVESLFLDEAERAAAELLVQEAVEERYILYRPSGGMLPLQETVLSTLYRRAFAMGDQEVLLQLENCLLRLDGVNEEPLMLQRNGDVTVSNPAASKNKRSSNVTVTKRGKGSPAAAATATLVAPEHTVMTSVERSMEAREFERHHVAMDQTYLFHHFESDAAPYCACGGHSRAEFHTEQPPALSFTAPDLAGRTDMLLLILLYRVLFQDVRGPVQYATEAKDIFGGDATIFENNTITTALVRSLEASALRVSMLPPRYALPRWVNFLLREGRFLIPMAVRARISRFLAYGARRSFIRHMRIFRTQRNDRAVAVLPGEWARMSNHKYTIDRDYFVRDAYVMLRKCADARFPISVEFKGDVGVGQGPTAQFYTLLAAEASRSKAELWRTGSDTQKSTKTASRNGSAAETVSAPLLVGPPPQTLPTRRSSVTPTSSPPRTGGGLSRRVSVTNRSITAAATPPPLPPSQQWTPSLPPSVPYVPISATLRAAPYMTHLSSASALEEEGYVVPPPEGLYPRHLSGVLRYADEVENMPCTPTLRRAHVAREDRSPKAAAMSHTSGLAGTPSAAGAPTVASVVRSTNNSTAHYDEAKAALLVDSNVGLVRDFVVEQRDRARAYYVVGAALGRAFLDEQIFPLPLSPALAYFVRRAFPAYQLVLSDATKIEPAPEFPIDVFELPLSAASWVDEEVAKSLGALSSMDSVTLGSLDLPFTLPGDDSYELLPNGANMSVTKKNLRQYQRRVLGALLYESVAVPLYFLTMGCRDVVPYEALEVMDVEELIGMLCGEDKHPNEPLWTTEEIRAVLVGDHGYQNDSPQLELLAKVLGARLTPAEQREFLLFCTGCPRLPIGGIRALGAITVVKRSNAFAVARHAAVANANGSGEAGSGDGVGGGGANGAAAEMDAEEDEDGAPLPAMDAHTVLSDQEEPSVHNQGSPWVDMLSQGPAMSEEAVGGGGGGTGISYPELPDSEWALPSVNTCFRYLKLPPYPTEDLLYRKLLQSITQTGGSFELS